MAGSLFERLTLGEAGMRMDEDSSIRAHLMRMLTSRQGSVQTLPDYGLPDLNDLTLSRSELELECAKAIEDCIERYEPRLCDVQVSPAKLDDAPFTMAFSISAMKKSDDGALSPWQWVMSMDSGKSYLR